MANETQEKINEYIDGLKMASDDYNIFLDLYEKCSDKLFARIMESLADDPSGDMISPRDLHTVLGEFSCLGDSLRNQRDLSREYELMKKTLDELALAKRLTEEETGSLLRNLIASQSYEEGGVNPEDIERMNVIAAELGKSSGDSLNDIYRMKVLQRIMKEYASGSAETAHAILLSVDDYMLPVDERYVQLSDFDRDYMAEKGLTEEQMRKIKSLAAFDLAEEEG